MGARVQLTRNTLFGNHAVAFGLCNGARGRVVGIRYAPQTGLVEYVAAENTVSELSRFMDHVKQGGGGGVGRVVVPGGGRRGGEWGGEELCGLERGGGEWRREEWWKGHETRRGVPPLFHAVDETRKIPDTLEIPTYCGPRCFSRTECQGLTIDGNTMCAADEDCKNTTCKQIHSNKIVPIPISEETENAGDFDGGPSASGSQTLANVPVRLCSHITIHRETGSTEPDGTVTDFKSARSIAKNGKLAYVGLTRTQCWELFAVVNMPGFAEFLMAREQPAFRDRLKYEVWLDAVHEKTMARLYGEGFDEFALHKQDNIAKHAKDPKGCPLWTAEEEKQICEVG